MKILDFFGFLQKREKKRERDSERKKDKNERSRRAFREVFNVKKKERIQSITMI